MSNRNRRARKLDPVRKACKSHKMSTIDLFTKAWQEKFGELNRKAVRVAHTAYQQLKNIPSWVTSYIERLNRPRVANPAPA